MLHRVTIPFLEALLFRYICGRRRKGLCRVVFDVDDATYLGKHGEESFNSVPDYIARNSDLVIAGNQYLSQHFSRIAKCIVIPTCVDLERYRQKNWDLIDRVDHQIVIGWTGLSTNLKYLVSLESVLGKLKQDFDFRLVIICEADTANPFPDSNLDVEMRAWSKVSEIEDLSEIDIGLMPLVDDAWSRGKCGFKLIQYMAIGMASVASPVGVNKEIIKHGANGYLASNEEEWIHCLSDLLGNKRRIKEFGLAGRLATIERFSTDRWSKNLIDALCLRNGQQRSED
jgi:glycosyltransferase involved in cell wall biosynthesis